MSEKEYKEKYFDQKFKNFDTKLDAIYSKLEENTKETRDNTKETKDMNSRVYKLEYWKNEKVDPYIDSSGYHDSEQDLPKWYKDPILMNFLKLVVIAVIVTIVAVVIFARDVNILESLI